jgi:murein DD-endopeptidase MepM/ murein hydrolase activator NlpD
VSGARGAALFLRTAAVAAALLLPACVTPRPVPTRPVTILAGESVWGILRRNGLSLEDFARANPRFDSTRLRPGETLRVPLRSAWDAPLPTGEREIAEFEWPLEGTYSAAGLNSPFGRRGGRHHDGIDLRAPLGTPVRAAAFGRVIASARAGAYGNIVVLRHPGRFVTVYAHNVENLVREGDWVARGQIIARVGRTGNATGPHLHFEVRRDGRPGDPFLFLPIGSPEPLVARTGGP